METPTRRSPQYFFSFARLRKEQDAFPSSLAVWLTALSEQLEEDDLAVTGNSFNIIIFFVIYIQF